MNIIVVGDQKFIKEFKTKFSKLIQSVNDNEETITVKNLNNGNSNNYSLEEIIFIENYEALDEDLLFKKAIVFDFFLDESIENFETYKNHSNLIIFGNLPKSCLSEVYFYYGNFEATLFGFNGLPGMLNRTYLEVTAIKEEDHSLLKEVCNVLNTEYLIVDDRVGMVTPRIISMIINEAYYTVQEGTASKEDIDTAMKLGTNYPWGPFEWCQLIGIKNVYELLEAIYEDTKDERYKICPLLKRAYIRSSI